MSLYTMGLDERNRITEFKLGFSVSGDQNQGSLSYDQIQTLNSMISSGDTRFKMSTDPTTGLKVYSTYMDLFYEVEMNAAAPKYIDVPYDPYPAVKWSINNKYVSESHNFDFKAGMKDEDYQAIWDSFSVLPRRHFEKAACDILSNIIQDKSFRGKSGEAILKLISWKNFIVLELPVFLAASHLIDIFNRANLQKCQEQNLTPAAWENLKLRSFSLKDVESEQATNLMNISKSPWARMWVDQQSKREMFEVRIKALPRTSDPLLNLQRDASLAALVQAEEWDKLDLICALYEAMPIEMIETFKTIS